VRKTVANKKTNTAASGKPVYANGKEIVFYFLAVLQLHSPIFPDFDNRQ